MNKEFNNISTSDKVVLVIGIIVFSLAGMFLIYMISHAVYDLFIYKPIAYNMELEPIQNDIYCISQSIYSNIPAENYQTIIVKSNGKLYHLNGKISFYDSSDTESHMIWTDTHLVHGDKIDIYVNTNKILFKESNYIKR